MVRDVQYFHNLVSLDYRDTWNNPGMPLVGVTDYTAWIPEYLVSHDTGEMFPPNHECCHHGKGYYTSRGIYK